MTQNERYWAAKKAQHQRALDFMAVAIPGETYRIERYAINDHAWPYEMSEYAHIHDKRTVTIYAVNKNNGALWFTTTTGEAIDAASLIKWEKLPKQGELF